METAKAKIDNRKDLLLLLLYSPGVTDRFNEPIVGRTRLMKMIFLFQTEVLPQLRRKLQLPSTGTYEFFPWNFGPFSREVYDDLNFFLLRGFVESKASSEDVVQEELEEWEQWRDSSGIDDVDRIAYEYIEEAFYLTDKGQEFAASLYDALVDNQQSALREFKKRMSNAPLRAILRYVYSTYPDQIGNSQIREKVLGG